VGNREILYFKSISQYQQKYMLKFSIAKNKNNEAKVPEQLLKGLKN